MKQESAMTTKTIHFTPGRVYCVNVDGDDGATPLLVKYQGPERPWHDICSDEPARIDVDAIDGVTEVAPVIVEAIVRANRSRSNADGGFAEHRDDDAPEMWEHDIYWDD
jgi:hypothetical protein